MEMHTHEWKILPSFDATHKEGDTHLSYIFKEYCDCGVYRTKYLKHLEDNKDGDMND